MRGVSGWTTKHKIYDPPRHRNVLLNDVARALCNHAVCTTKAWRKKSRRTALWFCVKASAYSQTALEQLKLTHLAWLADRSIRSTCVRERALSRSWSCWRCRISTTLTSRRASAPRTCVENTHAHFGEIFETQKRLYCDTFGGFWSRARACSLSTNACMNRAPHTWITVWSWRSPSSRTHSINARRQRSNRMSEQ